VGTDWTRAVKLLTYKEGVEAFRVSDRLSHGDRAKLMGGTASWIYGWSPSKASSTPCALGQDAARQRSITKRT
jgi:hypothetical protein